MCESVGLSCPALLLNAIQLGVGWVLSEANFLFGGRGKSSGYKQLKCLQTTFF